MDDAEFWSIIEDSHLASHGDMDRKDALIRAAVSELPPNEAESFFSIFNEMMDVAYNWGVWGAAYIVNGGCGDDTFSDFRASLISRGRAAFAKATTNPDSLADEAVDRNAWFHEGFQYAVMEGAEVALGRRPTRIGPAPGNPTGKRWTEATLCAEFPNLTKKYRG